MFSASLNEGTIASIFIIIESRQNNELITIHHENRRAVLIFYRKNGLFSTH